MPRNAKVRAAVEVDDVRRAFYESTEMQQALGTWAWIRAIRLDPTDLIVDDDEGGLWRVPYAMADDDEITFEDPVQVVIEYKDQAAAASAASAAVRFASPEESRRGTMAEDAVKASNNNQPKEGMMDVTIEQARALLGLGEDADEAAVQAALEERLAAGTEDEPEEEPQSDDNPAPPQDAPEVEPTPAPEGVVTIDSATLETLQRQAAAGAAAAERQRVEDRDRYIAAAVKEGRIVPARASHWKAQYDRDEAGTRAFIDSQPKGLVPVEEHGHGGDGDGVSASTGTEYNEAWLSPAERQRVAAARAQ